MSEVEKRTESYSNRGIDVLWVWGLNNYLDYNRVVKDVKEINFYYGNGDFFYKTRYAPSVSHKITSSDWRNVKRYVFCNEKFRLSEYNEKPTINLNSLNSFLADKPFFFHEGAWTFDKNKIETFRREKRIWNIKPENKQVLVKVSSLVENLQNDGENVYLSDDNIVVWPGKKK